MQRLTIGSLFSGIGGLELGLEWAGLGPVLWQVEKDPYCLKVLEKHWPDVRRYEDVSTVGSENLERVDLICGGFPCQDISCAGRGAGIKDGTRSGLWFEYARIIGEIRPRFIVVENVPALLTRGMDIVLGQLATFGYDAWWDCIPASAIGQAHHRERVFLVAYPTGERFISISILNKVYQQKLQAWWTDTSVLSIEIAGITKRYIGLGGGLRACNGVPARVDRLRALGNAVVPQVAQVIGEIVKELAHA